MTDELEAYELRPGHFVVRPAGQLGTIGWHPYAWRARFLDAPNAAEAVRRAVALGGCKVKETVRNEY